MTFVRLNLKENMKSLLISLLLLTSIQANAITCSIVGADGKLYYTQTAPNKTLGIVSTIKACAQPIMLIPYKDARGMKLDVNPTNLKAYPCYYLKVKDNTLQIYDATQVGGVCPAQVKN